MSYLIKIVGVEVDEIVRVARVPIAPEHVETPSGVYEISRVTLLALAPYANDPPDPLVAVCDAWAVRLNADRLTDPPAPGPPVRGR